MKTAELHETKGMFNLKLLSYLLNPKLLFGILLFDLSGITNFIFKYIFQDINYLKFLIVICGIDLITGIWKVIVTKGVKHVTSRGLRDTVTKVISYGSFLVLIHIITHFEVNGVPSTSFVWLNKVALEFLILIEVKSVYENIITINPKLDVIDSIIQKAFDKFKKSKKDDLK